ncbi:MAG TPA: hypothetical protein VI504_03050, partial [Candidatus Eisenbacteria bacterium]
MVSFETQPAALVDRAAPIGRGLWCWPALAAAAAVVLDACWPLMPRSGAMGVLWLDFAALGCLAWALLGRGRAKRTEWRTPLDGRIASGLVLAVLHVVRMGVAREPLLWLHQISAAGLCFYALGARLRREPRAPDAIWPALAVVLLALSAYVIGSATLGMGALRATGRAVDLHWASRFGLAKTLVLLTLLCVGRARERDARALWRATALTGAAASTLALLAGGAGLGVSSLANLDEPFYFGTSIVAFMLLASLSRLSWELARERPEEAGRWHAAACMFPLIAVFLLFGGTTGGEGVRALTGLAGAAV